MRHAYWCEQMLSIRRLSAAVTYNIYAWGARSSGVQGDGVTTPATRSPVLKLSTVKLLDIQSHQSSAYVTTANEGFVTGLNNTGQLGVGDTLPHSSWVQLPGSDWVKILIGNSFGIALKKDGSVYHAGSKSGSKDGNAGTSGNNETWTRITGAGYDNTDIAIGANHVVLLKTNGDIAPFGLNTSGQCCVGNTTSPVTTPTTISGADAKFIECAYNATLIIKNSDSKIYSSGGLPTVGFVTSKTSLTKLNDNTYKRIIGSGSSAASAVFAIRTDDTVDCWGNNGNGQQSDGTTTQHNTPISFDSGNTYLDIATGTIGSSGTIGIRSGGGMYGCGSYTVNGLGQASGNQLTMMQIGTDLWSGVSGKGNTFFAWK